MKNDLITRICCLRVSICIVGSLKVSFSFVLFSFFTGRFCGSLFCTTSLSRSIKQLARLGNFHELAIA